MIFVESMQTKQKLNMRKISFPVAFKLKGSHYEQCPLLRRGGVTPQERRRGRGVGFLSQTVQAQFVVALSTAVSCGGKPPVKSQFALCASSRYGDSAGALPSGVVTSLVLNPRLVLVITSGDWSNFAGRRRKLNT